MRFALVSDIHANRQAWQAVLNDIRNTGVDSILCLGDVVGYGPMPDAVLESVCEEVDEIVLGNHDAVVGGRLNEEIFSDDARRIIDWTRMILQDSATDLVAGLPDIVEGEHFLLAHGEVFDPERFGYIETQDDARENFGAENAGLIFVGHTHRPEIFVLDPQTDTIRAILANDFTVRPDLRYIVNVGSVGDPRDGLSTACYCMFDDGTGEVFFRRVVFDIDGYKEDLLDRGLDVTPCFIRNLRPAVTGKEEPLEPVEDWAMQMWAPPAQRTERPAEVLRVRHVDHGLTEEETAAVAAAQMRRQQLAGALKATKEKAERQRQARIEATMEALKRKQEAAETARIQKNVEEKAAAEQARLRKMELARSVEARQVENSRERQEARARMEELLKKRRETALEQKREEERARQAEGIGKTTVQSLRDLLREEAERKRAGESTSVTPAIVPQPPPQQAPETVAPGSVEPPASVGVVVPTDADRAKERKLAVIKAAEEKRQKRIRERQMQLHASRQMIQMKVEAARRAKETGKGG